MTEISLSFKHSRETKNAHVYNEVDDNGEVLEIKDAIVGAIYLKKSAIGDEAPEDITIVINVAAKAKKSATKTKTTATKKVAVKKKAA